MLRRILVVLMCLSLSWTTIACGSPSTVRPQQTFNNNVASAQVSITDGKYPVQQATYDDGTGEYSLMLLNTPPGTPPIIKTGNIQMARLTDENIAQGEKTYLQATDNQLVMYLTEDFRIEYVHNVTETATNPQTGQPQTVVVRRESNFWSPFAGALAGQALGSLLFRPQYYVPPIYSPGRIMTGYGGYGQNYTQAVNRYQERYNQAPAAVRNRQTLRTAGNFNSSKTKVSKPSSTNTRSTGSGFGSSTLKTSGSSKTKSYRRPSGFGSSRGSGIRSRSFRRR